MNLKKLATTLTASSVALTLTFTGSGAIQNAIKRIKDDAAKIAKYEGNELSLSNALMNAGDTIENLLQFKNAPDELQIANEEAAQLSTALEETASVEENTPLTDIEVEDLLSKVDVDIDTEVTKDVIIDKNLDQTLFKNDDILIRYTNVDKRVNVSLTGEVVDSIAYAAWHEGKKTHNSSVSMSIRVVEDGAYLSCLKIDFKDNDGNVLKTITFNISYK